MKKHFLISLTCLLASNAWPVTIDSTNLPILLIDTQNQRIMEEIKIMADMQIIYSGPGRINKPTDLPTEYNGRIGIEIRGHFSSKYPQKPYGIETRNSDESNRNVSLFGMPEENDWVLISNYSDKSLTRNLLPFSLFRQFGYYSPRAILCEVILNNTYDGIYVFCEKIKRDKGRVNIAKLDSTENAGDQVTGGYIFTIDYIEHGWYSDFTTQYHSGINDRVFFNYYYPKWYRMTYAQEQYLQEHIRQVETVLHSENCYDPDIGYSKYLDTASFIDFFIINELSRSIDGFKKSRFFYKNRDDKNPLIYAGPVWDFDGSFKNISSGNTIYKDTSGGGWSYLSNVHKPTTLTPDWYAILLQDTTFANQLTERYFALRATLLDTTQMFSFIDSVYQTVSSFGAKDRHFTIWPITARNMTPEVEPVSQTYEEELRKLKRWIAIRLKWMDANIAQVGSSMLPYVSIDSKPEISHPRFSFYPNPGMHVLHMQSEHTLRQVILYNILGQPVYETHPAQNLLTIPIHHLPTGMYILRVMDNLNKAEVHKISIVR